MNNDNPILYLNRFPPDPNGHGGARRVAQLINALQEFHIIPILKMITYPQWQESTPIYVNPYTLLKLKELIKKKLPWISDYRYWDKTFRDKTYHKKRAAYNWIHQIVKKNAFRLCLVDDPLLVEPIVRYFVNQRIPVVAHMHNLESLVAGNVTEKHQLSLLKKELEILSLCDAVVTISREEFILLRNLGINAVHLPYYPDRQVVERLKKIRTKRKNTLKTHTLLLGSATNKPTLYGMKKFLNDYQENGFSESLNKIIVAGHGTEQLKDSCGEDIKVLGTVSDSHLNDLLGVIKSCLCFQEKGAGSLTRIVEMLIANIPVLANPHAARSYYGLKGVIEFGHMQSLKKTIASQELDFLKIPMPQPPELDEINSTIKNLLK